MDDDRQDARDRGLRREAIIADALSSGFRADTTRLADLGGLVVRRAPLAPVTAAYLPPPVWGDRAILALDDTLRPDVAEYLTAVALGHLFLGHDRFHAYLYGSAGALYHVASEEKAADLFARHYLRADSQQSLALDA